MNDTETQTLPPPGPNLLADFKLTADEATTPEPTRPYWAFLDNECPVDAISFGGVTFQKSVELREGERTTSVRGQMLELTPTQVRLIEEDLQTRMLRIFYELKDGVRVRVGQQDVQFRRWERPGSQQNGAPLLGNDGKPIEKPRLVPFPGFQRRDGDVAWARYLVLEPLEGSSIRMFELMSGRRVGTRNLYEETKAANARAVHEEQSLATEAGISRRPRRPVANMGRVD